MNKKVLFSVLVAAFSIFIVFLIISGLRYHKNPPDTGAYKTITDMDDRKIEVPSDPRRIACLHGVSFERIVILGKESPCSVYESFSMDAEAFSGGEKFSDCRTSIHR